MKNTAFNTKNGKLTRYAFACGCKEKYFHHKGSGPILDINLFMEHTFYHVRGWYGGRHIMECFDTLTNAREYCAKEMREAKQNSMIKTR